MPRATGYVREIPRKGGDVFYAHLRLADGSRPQRRLGKVWRKRTRPPEGYLTRGMAEARLEAILAGDDPLVNIEPSRVTFGRACEEHLRYLEFERQRKAPYLRDCRHVMRCYLVPGLGGSRPVEDITTADVDTLRERLLLGELSPRRDNEPHALTHKTVQKVMTLLGGVMGRAERKGWIASNPCEHAERVSVPRGDEFNVLSVEQVHCVARAADDVVLSALFIVAAFTGLRQGELLALRWRHVDFGNRILHVRRNLPAGTEKEDTPKSHRVRSVPLSDQALVALAALSRREDFTGDDDLVFASPVGGHLSDDNVRDAFYAALEAAELGHLRAQPEPIVFHDLRHTFGTQCAAKGIDLRRIQAWMGHANIQTTMRYLHYVPQHDDAARLTAAFTPESVHRDVHRTGVMQPEMSATE
jgi:integrase